MKLNGIEALRGVAAVMVLLLHATNMLANAQPGSRPAFGGLFLFGRAGVDFFFVLSGFIIAHVHARDLGSPARFDTFWRKRLLRIYPTYWAVLALLGALLAISPTPDRAEQDPWHILTSILLLPDHYLYPIVGVAWSLRHELLFYGLFSLAILSRPLGRTVMAAWFAAILFNMAWAMGTGRPWFQGVWGDIVFRVFNIEFLFGLVAARMLARGEIRRPMLWLVAGAAIFLANGMAESFVRPPMHEWPVRHVLYALGSALMILGLATLDLRGRTRFPRPVLEVGAASYSLYLIHTTVLVILIELLKRARPFVDMPVELAYVLIVCLTVLAGVVFARLFERPLMRIGNRIFIAERTRDDQQLRPTFQPRLGLPGHRAGRDAGQDLAVVQAAAAPAAQGPAGRDALSPQDATPGAAP